MRKECIRSQFGLSSNQSCAASGGKPTQNAKFFVCVKESICSFGSLNTVAMSRMPKLKYISMMELPLLENFNDALPSYRHTPEEYFTGSLYGPEMLTERRALALPRALATYEIYEKARPR